MACNECDYKGYIESQMIRDGGMKMQIQQCSNCKDIKAYSQRVQEMVNGTAPAPKPRFKLVKSEEGD